jgi:hypothetical protein
VTTGLTGPPGLQYTSPPFTRLIPYEGRYLDLHKRGKQDGKQQKKKAALVDAQTFRNMQEEVHVVADSSHEGSIKQSRHEQGEAFRDEAREQKKAKNQKDQDQEKERKEEEKEQHHQQQEEALKQEAERIEQERQRTQALDHESREQRIHAEQDREKSEPGAPSSHALPSVREKETKGDENEQLRQEAKEALEQEDAQVEQERQRIQPLDYESREHRIHAEQDREESEPGALTRMSLEKMSDGEHPCIRWLCTVWPFGPCKDCPVHSQTHGWVGKGTYEGRFILSGTSPANYTYLNDGTKSKDGDERAS